MVITYYFHLYMLFTLGIFLQVSIMFVTLEKISQTDPKYADIFLLENYAAFQNRYFSFSQARLLVDPLSVS